jgi:DNA polymerase-1
MMLLYDKLNIIIDEKNLTKLYNEIELPLSEVLFDMECNGFMVDADILKQLQEKYQKELEEITLKIYEVSGVKFNINSNKQLSDVLYNKLNLPALKKIKTGISTNADVLNELKDLHPVIPLLIRYRQISTLNSTFLIGLLRVIDKDGKVHTIFKQTNSQTGRLSSTEPNLQNIPVRESEGRELRKAFIASKDNVLVCADYSQIELRILAHYSKDETLINAYNNNKDIHRYTASLVFGVPEDQVTYEMRRAAKAVNFGIIYGISDFGLSENIGISVHDAKDFIKKYFETYKKVKAYMNSNVEFAEKNGYVKSMESGRIRYIPELKSQNYNIRNFGKRVAMNMPLQGTAADIIKIAMINVNNDIKENHLKAMLTLSVHDELIVDCPKDEAEIVKSILKKEMEGAMKLDVPLIVEIGVGNSWFDAK